MVSQFRKLPYLEVIGQGRGDQKTYLYRVHLTPFRWWKLPRLYLHIFQRPDEDRHLHDHPWDFDTTVLWGGYEEVSHVMDVDGKPTGQFIVDKLSFLSKRKRKATHAHKITRLLSPVVVTLVSRSNSRFREWGFWVDFEGERRTEWEWIKWTDYMGLPERTEEVY